MISNKHKDVFTVFNYIKQLLILASAVTGCVSAFASLIDIPIKVTSSAVEIKI